MSSDDQGPERRGQQSKRRRLIRACDVCRKKKIRCDGLQMPGQQCTNCTDYGLDCTYVENAKKRGPPKLYIESLENRVMKLQSFIEKISPEALENLNISTKVTLPPPSSKPSKPTTQWPPYDSAPGRFIRHLGSSATPPPPLDDDEAFLLEDFSRMQLTSNEPRFFGPSSGIMLVKVALDLKRMHMGEDIFATRDRQALGMSGTRRPWGNSMLDSTPQTPVYTFPPPDLIATLIDLYFQHMNRYLPLFHRPTLERAVASGLHHTNTAFAATLLLLCAVAAKYTNDTRVMDDPDEPGGMPDPHSSGWKWFGQVPVVKTTPLVPPCLYELQFYALVGQFLQASSVPQACWTVVGIGIRIAQDVGAHRRKSRTVHTVEDELWNRTFWVLVCMDRLFSSSTGRPCSIHDEDFDIDMPIECDDEYWEHPDPKLRWRQPTPEKTPSVIVYFNLYIRLNQILAFLLRTVYAINKSRILHGFVGQQWEENIVSELDSALNAWMTALPDHLRWDPSRPNETFFNQSASLYCFYQHIQILVHRPFIPSPQKPNAALSFPSLAICTNAARACSHALDAQRRRFGSAPAPPPLTTAAFSAGVVLLLSIWGGRRAGLVTDYDKEMSDVKKCTDVLRHAEVRWYLAGRLNDILQELAFVGDVPIPQRTSNSPPVSGTKRDRKQEEEASDEDDDKDSDYIPPKGHASSGARAGGRYRKQPDVVVKGSTSTARRPDARMQTGVPQPLSQRPTLPSYNSDYRRPPQQQQQQQRLPSHPQPSLNTQQYWPRQGMSQTPPKQYDAYSRPHSIVPSQMPTNLPALSQNFGHASYGNDMGGMSSFVLPRGEGSSGSQRGYSYGTGTDPVGTVGMNVDMSMRERPSSSLVMDTSGDMAAEETYSMWSDAPPGFELDQWGNYLSGLNPQGAPGSGHYTHG